MDFYDLDRNCAITDGTIALGDRWPITRDLYVLQKRE